MSERGTEVTFTNVLYGIVASNALFRLSFDLGLRNAMLLFAFFVLAMDWVEYHVATADVEGGVDASLQQFGLDMTVLVAWSFLTVTPVARMDVYLALLGVFVFLQGVWDRLLLGARLPELLRGAEWQLAAAFAVLVAVPLVVEVRPGVLFGAGVVLFVARKAVRWRTLYVEAKRTDQALEI